MADPADAPLQAALRRRQGLLDFVCFRLLLRQGNLAEAFPYGVRVPPAYMGACVRDALGRRMESGKAAIRLRRTA